MANQPDYYAILGVAPHAEDVVIRAAYKALVQRHHPDRVVGDKHDATNRLAEINEAFEVLSNSNRRKQYDSEQGGGIFDVTRFLNEQENPSPADPLEDSWQLATEYYPDLIRMERRLSAIASRLAYAYRAFIIEGKEFKDRIDIALSMEWDFLKSYFGDNPKIIQFAKELIDLKTPKARAGLLRLNRTVMVLGSNYEPEQIIAKIRKDVCTES